MIAARTPARRSNARYDAFPCTATGVLDANDGRGEVKKIKLHMVAARAAVEKFVSCNCELYSIFCQQQTSVSDRRGNRLCLRLCRNREGVAHGSNQCRKATPLAPAP